MLHDIHHPDPLGEAAYYGLAGEIVRKMEPHTEADPAALLLHLYAAYGNVIGREAHLFDGSGVEHHCNLFVVLVGQSAKSRRGTSQHNVNHILKEVAPDWVVDHNHEGLASGEGAIWVIRDKIESRIPVKVKGRFTGEYDIVEIDPGVADKRLFVMEPEFGGLLAAQGREGNTLSAFLRKAWDGPDKLKNMSKGKPGQATKPHVSIVAHITLPELREKLAKTTEVFNGGSNRFLWVHVHRSKFLAEGSGLRDVSFSDEVVRVEAAIEYGRQPRLIALDAEAREMWRTMYIELEAEHPGVFGAVTARSSAQVLRLAMTAAVMNQSPWIKPVHLQTAREIWRYCEQSAAYIFSGAGADPLAGLVEWIEGRGGRVTARDVAHGMRRYRNDVDRATMDLQALFDDGRGRWETHTPSARGGRPITEFILDQACHRHRNPENVEKCEGNGDGDTSDEVKSERMGRVTF